MKKPAVAKRFQTPPFYRAPAFRFVAFFVFYLLLLGGGYSQLSSRSASFHDGFPILTARLVGFCYGWGNRAVSVSENSIAGGGVAIEVIEECTGAYEMIIFVAAVLAFPAGWKKRGWGILLGIPALYVINILRMVLLAYVQVHRPGWFDFMHIYFWQATLIIMILGIFILWIKLMVFRHAKIA
jgi:archaeosortase B (VPXXXP-CTERM-specific)